MKSRQMLTVLCVLFSSLCWAETDNSNQGPELFYPNPYMQSMYNFWKYIANNFPVPSFTFMEGQGSNNQQSGCNSGSTPTQGATSPSTNSTSESTTQSRSKLKAHPGASHSEHKIHHQHVKKHEKGEKRKGHDRHKTDHAKEKNHQHEGHHDVHHGKEK